MSRQSKLGKIVKEGQIDYDDSFSEEEEPEFSQGIIWLK